LFKDKNFELTAPGLFTSPDGIIGGGAGTEVTPGIGGFDIETTPVNIAVAHFPSGVAAVLKALQEKGFGKILAEPNLVVRSGEIGKFHVGKRIPIQTVTGVGAAATISITYEDVGIRLNFAPEVLETNVIRLKIDPAEVSSVARYIAFSGILAPEIDTRTVSTNVDLKEGESIILAGLLSEEMKKNIQKIPILGDIPILGAFFRSTRDELVDLELAFFITPRLGKPIAPGVKTPLPTDNRPTPAEEREFQWIPIPKSSSDGEVKSKP
jgi:pilus assembly protein CpaC